MSISEVSVNNNFVSLDRQKTICEIINTEDFEKITSFFTSNLNRIQEKDKNGNTALHHAVIAKRLDVVQFLLESGAEVDAQNLKGQTALHLAIDDGDCCDKICQLLFSHHASVDIQDGHGNTPLMDAVFLDNELIQLLIEKGANTNLINNCGHSAIDLAVDLKYPSVVSVVMHLLQAQAKLSNLETCKSLYRKIIVPKEVKSKYNKIILSDFSVQKLIEGYLSAQGDTKAVPIKAFCIFENLHGPLIDGLPEEAMSQQWLSGSILGNILGFQGSFRLGKEDFPLEGNTDFYMQKKILENMTSFFEDNSDLISNQIANELIQAFEVSTQETKNPQYYLDRIRTGHLTVVPTGYKKHSIKIIIFQNWMFICNTNQNPTVKP